jgi:hypothetical protein
MKTAELELAAEVERFFWSARWGRSESSATTRSSHIIDRRGFFWPQIRGAVPIPIKIIIGLAQTHSPVRSMVNAT